MKKTCLCKNTYMSKKIIEKNSQHPLFKKNNNFDFWTIEQINKHDILDEYNFPYRNT